MKQMTRIYLIDKLIKKLFAAIISSLVLMGIGLVIWYFVRESKTYLQDIFFIVGAVPIAIFALGMMGNFSARGNFFIQFSRSASNQSLNKRAQQDIGDMKSIVLSEMNWIMAGLFVWIICYFM